jgi:hypothetical protein
MTGWARRSDGTVDGGSLMAEITTGGFGRPVRFSRKRLPDGEWDGLWLMAYSDEDVEQTFSSFNPVLLVPSGKTYGDDEALTKNSKPGEAWQLREEFLKLNPTPENAIAFLNQWGRWNAEEYIELSEIVDLQRAIREAVTTLPGKWFESPNSLPSNWRRRPEYPFFSLVTDKAEVALRMTVTYDLLGQSQFKTCSRPDCGQPFRVESKHDRKFCSRTCAHVEAVRRSRTAANEKRA